MNMPSDPTIQKMQKELSLGETVVDDGPKGKVLQEIRDTKMAVDDVFHVLSELHARLYPILKVDSRTTQADPEAETPASTDSDVFDQLHAINQKVYNIQEIVRNFTERVDL